MTINQIVMYVMAFGAVLGGTDQLLGNKFGYGEKFENGFRMLGPVGLSMAGIVCLAPVLSSVLGTVITPLCALFHMDPGVFGSILAIDMGGYQLSVDLARDPLLGLLSGVVISSIFGCTIVYSIPVGLGFLEEADRPNFTRGILYGLVSMPFSIIAASLVLKMKLGYVLWNCLPIFLFSLLLGKGIIKKPNAMIRGLQAFAKGIRFFAILGLMLAAVAHMTGFSLFPNMMSLQEAMQTVSTICITMLGSMPLAELIQRILKTPFRKIDEKTGLNSASSTSLLLSFFGATPSLALLPHMTRRGQVVISACIVSTVNIFGAHFAFANSWNPEMVPALLAAKIVGGLVGGGIAMYATRNLNDKF